VAGQFLKIDIRDFEVSRGLSSPKSPDEHTFTYTFDPVFLQLTVTVTEIAK